MEELAKAFDPKLIEDKWYSFWEKGHFFNADAHSSKPPYCISIPPPNVTGTLHMGHGLVDTLQDVMIRYKRMSGYETLWVPGTDHAGIATQTVVERDLIAKTGKRRKDFPREEFVKIVWQWKEQSEKRILQQLKRLGCSCDWTRLCFTMDEKRNRAVRTMFKKMFDEKLIYRGDYLVNWDPVTQTALADDEVEYEERDTFLWHIRYPLESQKGYIIIATTRPETMLGDVAVAVHPEDPRYKQLIGKKISLPFVNRLIPILADEFVDPSFATGAVKITPAHDPNDYEMAKRHGLSMINIMTPDGKVNENGKAFANLPMEEARFAVVEHLKEMGLIEKIEKYRHRVGVSYRSKAIIEPYLSKQWFVRMSGFKEKLLSAVKEKRVKIIPDHWEQTYFHWIENLRDWCISRQLWWGHRIPIWYHRNDKERMICYAGEGNPPEVAAHPNEWVQDEDVLDTWFSSALWPFSVLGWPEKTADLKKFYPNSTLITGHDILFFWVARMILMGEYALDQVPFFETFIHGLIYGKSYWRYQKDGSIHYISGKERLDYDLGQTPPADIQFKWEKMSKSKGNVIDPLEIIDTYGTDAMRFGLCASATQARQIDLDRRRFEEYKNFINKIWNGARFVFMNLETLTPERFARGLDLRLLKLEDRWILSRLNQVISQVDQLLNQYFFDRVANLLYDFFWKEFCAYYLELVKPILFEKMGTKEEKENKQILLCMLLDHLIRLMHPIAPFITEELFQLLKKQFGQASQEHTKDAYTQKTLDALKAPSCIVAPYPKVIQHEDIDLGIEETFTLMDRLVHAVRNIRAEMQIAPSIETSLYIVSNAKDPELILVQKHQNILTTLTRTSTPTFQEKEPKIEFAASAFVKNLKLIIPLPEELKEKERLRLSKEKEKLISEQNQVRAQLANREFIDKAPKPLVEKYKLNLEDLEKKLNDIIKKLEKF